MKKASASINLQMFKSPDGPLLLATLHPLIRNNIHSPPNPNRLNSNHLLKHGIGVVSGVADGFGTDRNESHACHVLEAGTGGKPAVGRALDGERKGKWE